MENAKPTTDIIAQHERQILEASPVGSLITRISDGTILFANRAIGKMLGIEDVSTVIGTPVPDFYGDPAERQIVLSRFRAEGALEGYEMRARRLDGSLFWVSISLQLFNFEGETTILSTVLDITAKKEIELRLRSIYDSSGDALMLLTADGFIDCNPHTLELFGFTSKEDFIAIHPGDISPELQPNGHPSRQEAQAHIQLALETGKNRFEWTHRRTDGSDFPAEVTLSRLELGSGNILQATVRDITQQKRAEQSLIASQNVLRSLLDSLPQPVIVTHISDGTVLYANPQLSQLFGIPLDQMIGMQTPDFYANPADRLNFVQTLKKEGRVRGAEIQLKRQDGSLFWTEITIELTNYQGALATVAVIEDITARRQAQAEIIAQRERLQSIAANVPGVVYQFYALPSGEFGLTYVSERAVEVFELQGNIETFFPEFVAHLHPDDRTAFIDSIQQAAATVSPWHYEGRFVKNSGSVLWFSGASTPILMADRVVFNGLLLDISEQRQAQEALRVNEERLELALNAANIANWEFEPLAGRVYFSPRWYTMLGYEPDELPQAYETWAGLLHPDDRTWVEPQVGQAIQAGTDFDAIFRMKTRDGNWRWINAIGRTTDRNEAGVTTRMVGTHLDITERKKADEDLTAQRQFLRQVLDADPNLIFVKDRQGRFILLNQALAELYGSTIAEMLGKSDADFNPNQEEVKHYWQDDLEVINGKKEKFIAEETITDADGRVRWLQTIKRPLIEADGTAHQLFGVSTDITERKNLELQVQQSLERRGYQVQLSTEISQEIAASSDLVSLFERVVTLIKERLGYYHAQLLRYDPTQDAVVLIAGYGETGAKMLAANHRMALGHGLIGVAAARGETVMRPTLTDDPDWQPNPLLPETQGEIAVPIKLGQQVLGVLDVQISQAGALTNDDRLLLEGLCGQIAIVMEQTRLRQEMQERLEEINLLYRTMNRTGWDSFLETAELPDGFLFDQAGIRPLNVDSPVNIESFASAALAVPGGVSIGTLALSDDPDRPLTPEDHVFLQQISEQVALALESARLFSQTQTTLAQTETLYAGSERIIRTEKMNDTLAALLETTALKRFGRASIMLFNRPWAVQPPETGIVVAQWTQPGNSAIVPMGAVFPIGQLPFAGFMRRDAPVFIPNIEADERVDPQTRAMISGIGRSMAFFPLVAGDQWFGFLITASNETINLNPDALRQVESLVGQAATVIQSIRLYEQAQAAAQRERILREVTTQVRSSIDADTILRTAVRELGQALGRETFVRIGGQTSSGADATSTGQ